MGTKKGSSYSFSFWCPWFPFKAALNGTNEKASVERSRTRAFHTGMLQWTTRKVHAGMAVELYWTHHTAPNPKHLISLSAHSDRPCSNNQKPLPLPFFIWTVVFPNWKNCQNMKSCNTLYWNSRRPPPKGIGIRGATWRQAVAAWMTRILGPGQL